jgi:integrase
MSGLSTGKETRDEALLVVYQWEQEGIPERKQTRADTKPSRPVDAVLNTAQIISELKKADLSAQDVLKIEKVLQDKGLVTFIIQKETRAAELFEEYLTCFWDYDRSPYVEEKHSHKIHIGRTHTTQSLQRAKRYWIPHFKGKYLGGISREDVKAFSVVLAKENPELKPSTLKRIMQVGVKALRYAYLNGFIPSDPTMALMGYSSKTKKRGVLSPEEAMALFQLQWTDNRAFLACLTAMTTGLRVSEVVSLKVENIGNKFLVIESSYSRLDGLKSTKTEESRRVPIIPVLREALIKLGETNPHNNGYIFYCDKPDRPWDQEGPLLQLKKMLVRLRMGEAVNEADVEKRKKAKEEAIAYWKQRNIVFHSFRHLYSARLADLVEARKLMLTTGHKTLSVFQAYADHALENDFNEVADAANKVFSPILPCKDGQLEQNIQGSRYDREKLSKEVWAEPMTSVAKRYGVSDVALGKACKKLGIPKPPRGYWTKVCKGDGTPGFPAG